MPFISKSAMEIAEPKPGWVGHFCQSPNMSFVQYEIAAGESLHEHNHDNEEVWIVLGGRIEMTVDGETNVAGAGDIVVVPGGGKHSAHTLTDVHAIVIDQPARMEFLRRFARKA